MKVLLISPGASWSTADVESGLRYGLEQQGVEVVRFRLDQRILHSRRWLNIAWRQASRKNPQLGKPTSADIFYQAGVDAIPIALRHEVDAVLAISGMFWHPDVPILMRRAGLRVVVLFTESPYDTDQEMKYARLVDACWTNERSSVADIKRVNARCAYLPHAWHPLHHRAGEQTADEIVRAHDVVFVGSAFEERIEWLNAIDWDGIDLGLYGNWGALPSRHQLRRFVKGGTVPNTTTAALYRRAKIGLNLYRTSKGFGKNAPHIAHAESLNPRAYELAACGAFSISTYRAEVPEVFDTLVPTFNTPEEASDVIRQWLADPQGRGRAQRDLPACVAESTWVHRASDVVGDIQSLLTERAA